MGGQDGYGRDLLTYDTDSDTLMAGVHVKPTERFGLGLHFSWTESEAGMRQLEIDGGEYLDTHPTVVYDFSNSHTYSALDLSRREGSISAGYKVNETVNVKLKYHWINFDDNEPYLYDTSGSIDSYFAALIWKF
jgi:hypothetical protein